jgi:anthranilate phosphoribosyltransferase
VLFNSAAALFVAGKAKSLSEGWTLAEETIDGGKAAAKLKELVG